MRRELLMPKLGLTMTEGLLVEWSVPEGGPFKAGDVLFLVETEKVVTEIEAEHDGTLLQAVVPPGDTVPVGTVIAFWDDAAGEGAAVGAAVGAARGATAPPAAGAPRATSGASQPAARVAHAAAAGGASARIVATPLARRIAEQGGVDLATVRGSGPRGRIKAADVHAAAQAGRGPATTSPAAAETRPVGALAPALAMAAPAATAKPVAKPADGASVKPAPAAAGVRGATRVEPTSVQAAAARRLTAIKATVPHFYLSIDADVGRLVALRDELNACAPLRLSLNHFVVAALGRALVDEPSANRVWHDDAILQFDGSDVGVAVNTDRGLFVPVVRDAGRLPLVELARGARTLVERAREGRLGAPDVSGGAVTVSNAGMFNVAYMTPIINPGQAMILGVGSVRDVFRPDAQGQPTLRREMGLVLACDHRIVDGVAGLRFLNRVAGYLEQPMKLALGA